MTKKTSRTWNDSSDDRHSDCSERRQNERSLHQQPWQEIHVSADYERRNLFRSNLVDHTRYFLF